LARRPSCESFVHFLNEAIHSSTDTVNQILLLIGNKRSRARADASHAFGYGMEVYFWSFVVALMVFVLGGMLSIYEVEFFIDKAPVGSAAAAR